MWWKQKRIYLDYAAATPVCARAKRAYEKAREHVGNPSAIHKEGVESRHILESARRDVSLFFECRARCIFFTSGGTESNNLAILGYANALEKSGKKLSDTHWIVNALEHPSVLECFRELERRNAEVTYLNPDERGEVSPSAVKGALCENTALVSIGWANGEIGVVQPIPAIAKVVRTHEREYHTRIIFHTDAGQAPLYFSTTAHGLGVDMLTLDSGKCYGPKGIGFLYKADDVELGPLFWGGGQEKGLRAGSEPHALAAGFAGALLWVKEIREKEVARLKKLRVLLISELQTQFPDGILNGNTKNTLPHIVNISLPYINGEYVTLALDQRGVAISTKSSCREGEEDESHTVRALGGAPWRARSTLRISFGVATSRRSVMRIVRALTDIITSQNRHS